MKSEKKNITIKIYGNFKDTGIRFSAMHEAYKAGVNGIAKYTDDSAVYLEAEGYTEQVEQFEIWCLKIAEKYAKKNPEIGYQKLQGYTDFSIVD